ncbi:MAG: autotransporter domain-containing protein, partial [Fusobacterium varium]|nr:autotransporter domain-containing protein [Fusobacterium varium]
MISNFNEVEKSLKRCLKEKISITTATVVGFLIAGTVAFGVDYATNEAFSKAVEEKLNNQYGIKLEEGGNLTGIKYEFEFKGEPSAIRRLITVTGGKTTLDKDTKLSTSEGMTLLNIVGEDKNGITEVISEATLINNNSSLKEEDEYYWRPTVIVNANYGNTSFTNSGTITKEGHPEYNCAIDLSSGQGYTSTFTNIGTINGLIKSDSNKDKDTELEKQLGDIIINLKDSSRINGEFSFAGGGTRTINIDNNKDDLTINNTTDNDTYVRTNNSDITLSGKIQSKGTTVELSNRDGDNTLTNYADIIGKTGIGVADTEQDTNPEAKNRTVTIKNN